MVVPVFTLLTESRETFHVSQHETPSPEQAVALHIGRYPYDDGDGPFDDELDWLLKGGGRPDRLQGRRELIDSFYEVI